MAGLANFGKTLLFGFAGKKLYDAAQGSPNAPLPDLPAPIAAPTPDLSGEIAAAKRRQRQAGMTAPAKGGTLLTGPMGVETPATTQRSTLLGGA